MRRLCWFVLALLIGTWLCLTSGAVWAESGVLVVHVKDVQRHPIGGVQIGVEGDGGSATTGDDGKARIALAKETKEKSWVSLQILKSPQNKDFVLVSPWDYRAVVPSFENETENFVEVVIVQRGDRLALESGTALVALTAQINKANAPKTSDKQASQEDPKANLTAVAKQYGLAADELDRAIRTWGVKATDPYEAGLAALYERSYAKASTQLAESLQKREEKLATDQKDVADTAFFLGLSLYAEGKYRESATNYQRCLQLRPDDSAVLNKLGLSLAAAGDYTAAEPLYRRALAIREKALGHDHPDVATSLNNLAELLQDEGDYAAAEPLYRRALIIDEKALGPDHPGVATSLNNLAELLRDKGDYAAAEPLYGRALIIDEKALGPDHPDVATDLNNLALLLKAKGDYAAAEPLCRRALAIDEKTLGPNHPQTEQIRHNLESLSPRDSVQKPER
jgi:tetratricopeptide (TPR) repeat protein